MTQASGQDSRLILAFFHRSREKGRLWSSQNCITFINTFFKLLQTATETYGTLSSSFWKASSSSSASPLLCSATSSSSRLALPKPKWRLSKDCFKEIQRLNKSHTHTHCPWQLRLANMMTWKNIMRFNHEITRMMGVQKEKQKGCQEKKRCSNELKAVTEHSNQEKRHWNPCNWIQLTQTYSLYNCYMCTVCAVSRICAHALQYTHVFIMVL